MCETPADFDTDVGVRSAAGIGFGDLVHDNLFGVHSLAI
jgi:hypothetical protein